MRKHPFIFLKDNKLWIIKTLFILFAIISCIIFFTQYVQYGVRKYNTCRQIHPFLLSFGLLCIFFTICSTTIIFLQWRKSTKIGYAHLEKDKEIEREKGWEREVEMELEQEQQEEKEREDEALSKLQRIFKISCFTFTIVSSLFLVGILIAFSVVQNSFLPQINGNLRLKGLLADATIEREPNGVLHIKANNEHDMYFAQGVAMAQERLWEMEFFRRVGNGSLSEILGNATFETDLLFRTLGLRKAAEASIDDLSADGAMAMNAFVQGINSYLETNPKLPAEFKLLGFKPAPFVAADSAIMIKILGFELAGNYWRELFYHNLKFGLHLSDSEIDSLTPEYPENAPTILDDEDIKHINFTYEFDPITFVRSFDKQYKNFPHENSQKIERKISVEKLMKQSGILQGFDMSFKSASNNWVLSGNRSLSGKPLLCNDPHLTISAPSIWVMMHLESPGVSVVGVTPCGAPAITLGRNSDIAWGVTNTFIDVQDIYILEEDKNETGYYHNSEFVQYGYRHEIIKIKGEEDFILNVRESIYGPVISDIMETQGQIAAFRWVALDDNDTTFNALVGLTKAKTFSEFRNCLRSYVGPSQNFVFADIAGNIGYQCPGRIPSRAPGHTGRFPVPGNGSYDWIGWIKYDELPYVLNPSKGYVVSANNKITPPSYPYLLLNNHDWEAHYRALSITEMINKTKQNTVKTMRDIQFNSVTGLWRDFKPYLSKIPDNLLDDNGLKWKGKLAGWNGNTTAESLDATVFEYWVFYLGRLGSKAGFYSYGEPYFILNSLSNNSCGSTDCIRYLASAFSQNRAVTIGADREWGDVHRLIIEHPIMSQSPLSCVYDRELRSGGDVYTINIGAFSSSVTEETSNPFDSYHGPSYRQIVDLSNMENSEFIIPMGNSGNVLDKNYDNMNKDFFSGKYYGMKTKDYKVAHTLTLK